MLQGSAMTPIERFARLRTAEGAVHFARLFESDAELLSDAPWHAGAPTGNRVPLEHSSLLCPVTPTKVLGVGKNYRAHAREMGGDAPSEPLLFSKLVSSLVGPGATVILPAESQRVDHEGELGVIIGRPCRRVAVREALDFVFGYTIVCDVTARDLQARDGQWTRAKGFDTFCPVGPVIATSLDPAVLEVILTVNGELRQRGATREMVFNIAELVSFASAFCTLEPGDLIATGTPEGVGPLRTGDRVVVSIGGIGELAFGVEEEAASTQTMRGGSV